MKILFVSFIDIGTRKHEGVRKKVLAQVKALQDTSARVDFVYVSEGTLYKDGERIAVLVGGNRAQRGARLFFGQWELLMTLPLDTYDILYVRHTRNTPSFVLFLREYKKERPNGKTCIEIPTYPYRHECSTVLDSALHFVDQLCALLLKHYVDRIVTFYGQTAIFGIQTIQLSNGVDIAETPRKTAGFMTDEVLRLVCVANLTSWHGLDRMIEGIRRYYEPGVEHSRRVEVHIVGVGAAEPSLKAMAEQYALGRYVHFHGFLQGRALDDLFELCDVGICTLGMHRKNLMRDSSLKTREYCSRGIPLVLSADDSDFPRSLPWVHYVPDDNSPIDIAGLVLRFTVLFTGQVDGALTRTIRSYAVEHLSWAPRMQLVLDRIQATATNEVSGETV